ncbi:MAG: hypothetical protein H5U40_07005, partial [Polyangiaceae bacterium]|nr:hypothetical protein [Polyangiaceae bacterium]
GGTSIGGDLAIPPEPRGLVILAFASGGGRHRREQRELASSLNHDRLATLLVDLLSPAEEGVEATSSRSPETSVLAKRIEGILDWAHERSDIGDLPLGILSEASTGAAALTTAARRPDEVKALVLRGGDLYEVEAELGKISSPTLVLVGDQAVEAAAKEAGAKIRGELRVERLASRDPIGEEPGMPDSVARASSDWLGRHLAEHDA